MSPHHHTAIYWHQAYTATNSLTNKCHYSISHATSTHQYCVTKLTMLPTPCCHDFQLPQKQMLLLHKPFHRNKAKLCHQADMATNSLMNKCHQNPCQQYTAIMFHQANMANKSLTDKCHYWKSHATSTHHYFLPSQHCYPLPHKKNTSQNEPYHLQTAILFCQVKTTIQTPLQIKHTTETS